MTDEKTILNEEDEPQLLEDGELEMVAGGTLGSTCPKCGSANIKYLGANTSECQDCGYIG